MKLTLKVVLAIGLFGSIALGEGNMGNGGFADDGNMGNGGRPCSQNCQISDQTDRNIGQTNVVLEYVQDFLTKIFG